MSADPAERLAQARAAAAALDDQAVVDAFAEVQARVRELHAREAVLAADISARIAAQGMRVSGAADQLAVLAVISPRAADNLLDFCEALVDRPRVWAALADGRIDKAKARLILDLLGEVDDPERDGLEAKAVAFAATHTSYRLRRFLLELVCAGDADGALRDAAVAKRGGVDRSARPRDGRCARPPVGRARRDLLPDVEHAGRGGRLPGPARAG